MNREQANSIIRQTFKNAFNKNLYHNFVNNILNGFDDSENRRIKRNPQMIKAAFKEHVRDYERLGTYISPSGDKLDVLIVYLTSDSKLERARTAIRNFVADHLKKRDDKDAALVAFVSPSESSWRFSYIKMEYTAVEKASGKVGVESHLTPAKRFSYLVGEGESCHTAQSRFLDLLKDTANKPSLANIEEAFSVEAVAKQFFNEYAKLVENLKQELDKLATNDNALLQELERSNVRTVDFAKKLMGQIVFLYFLQKKGWLGVTKGEPWSSGPKNFLRRLASGEYGEYVNFFDNALEPLFYDTLATDRGHEAWCEQFNCRIPFLNGGLFEPLGDYDWKNTNITIPNRLFTNNDFIDEGVIGSGVLDVFDRYNFTVNEDEPLEKEVAIDPEMLGKVFENLIEDNQRKGLGAFYTPREIVHYMCQESLINYLDTSLNTSEKPLAPNSQPKLFDDAPAIQPALTMPSYEEIVPRADIERFVHLGDQISHYESVETVYDITMPKSITANARLIDDKLSEITICDPAVGSGAFPVGMMSEIVRARCALTPYFNDVHERTPYYFKRHAIQYSLYGVDVDAGAVEIAKLRLWLSLVVDETDVQQIRPLPNLDYKIITGNSLIGFPFKSERMDAIEKLKQKFFEESDHDKKAVLKRQIDTAIERYFQGSKKSLGYEVNFDFQIYFSEVFNGKNGFDIVLANPPYIDSETMTKTAKALRDTVQATYKFTKGNWDIYIAFFELGFKCLNSSGVLSFITPDKWISKPFGNEMRRRTTSQLVSILRAGREIFENAKVDAIVTVYCRKESHGIQVRDYDGYVISSKRTVLKSELQSPFTYDWFFSDNLNFLSKIEDTGLRLESLGICENSCATSDAYKLKVFLENSTGEPDPNKYFKIINTGTIAKYVSRWGIREMMYLGDKYICPVVERTVFLQQFPNSYGKKSLKPKLIAKGLNLLDVCLDENGSYIAGKTTLIITSFNLKTLKIILALLNHPLALFYFKQRYPASSYNQGTTFTKDMVNDFPIPQISAPVADVIINLVDSILSSKIQEQSSGRFENELRKQIYDLYQLTLDEIAIVEGSVAKGIKITPRCQMATLDKKVN